jgi:hypothetical protein
MLSGGRRLKTRASSNRERIQVLFPVPLGPNRKKEVPGVASVRVYIDTNFTVILASMSTDGPSVNTVHSSLTTAAAS